MIRKDIDPIKLSESYRCAEPFPHAVIDGFFDEDLANRIADDLEAQEVTGWLFDPHSEQVNKWSMPVLSNLTDPVAAALREFNSETTLKFFQDLTGIADLREDNSYLGGGVHISARGGRLGIHADFNLHPETGLHRRLNALLFLNRNWDPTWNGQLQLWDKDVTRCVKSVEPVFNRLVVFNVTDDSFHGVPDTIDCPPDRRRLSLALYYYTDDRPDHEKGPFHWASWKNPTE
jgi:Rps23 Pro-64 3,4-dihydroxylase Tpa1-like proline 4-hydroxylase